MVTAFGLEGGGADAVAAFSYSQCRVEVPLLPTCLGEAASSRTEQCATEAPSVSLSITRLQSEEPTERKTRTLKRYIFKELVVLYGNYRIPVVTAGKISLLV